MDDRILEINDNNICSIRERYPDGLHFVIGDTHGEYGTLRCLLKKIGFDAEKDHAFFVGDYNCGGDVVSLLNVIDKYYSEDYCLPGFHLIRGNHERVFDPPFPLRNMPDIIVYKSKVMNYFIAHAGMVKAGFDIICDDMKKNPFEQVYAYSLSDASAREGAPLGQIVWSKNGLYSQRSRNHVWPSEDSLRTSRACIIHGHTPFGMMKIADWFSYGERMLFWEKQKIWFAEDLQSFDIDSNVKGKYIYHEPYRGLSCLCLEIMDEAARKNSGYLQIDELRKAENFVFSVPYERNIDPPQRNMPLHILNARPKLKKIGLDESGQPYIMKDEY